jgi:hypothetical protein
LGAGRRRTAARKAPPNRRRESPPRADGFPLGEGYTHRNGAGARPSGRL